jgi:hypothetical protein
MRRPPRPVLFTGCSALFLVLTALPSAVAARATPSVTQSTISSQAHGPPTPGARLWVKRYDGQGSTDIPQSLGVSPDGSRVFVTGSSLQSSGYHDYATIAYDASTGARLWNARYDGPAHTQDAAYSLGVSPDGARVFVTGFSASWSAGVVYSTIADDAATGTRQGVARHNGSANASDVAYSLGVSPDGARVFVTGYTSALPNYPTPDYTTVAYDASTGAKLWVASYHGAGHDDDIAYSLAVSPDGARVFVTGYSFTSSGGYDYATIAYDATTGARLWIARYNGPGNGTDQARSVKVGPDGETVFVTGTSPRSSTGSDYATIAHSASTGARMWVARYTGLGNLSDSAESVGVSADGTRVFVTGYSWSTSIGGDYATITYIAS